MCPATSVEISEVWFWMSAIMRKFCANRIHGRCSYRATLGKLSRNRSPKVSRTELPLYIRLDNDDEIEDGPNLRGHGWRCQLCESLDSFPPSGSFSHLSQAALWSYQATHHFLPRPTPRPPASPVSFENLFNLQCWLLKSTPDTTVKYSTPRPCHSQPDLLKLILFITQKLEHSSWMVTNSNLISLQPWTEKWPSHFASIHFLGGPDSSASPVVSQSCRNGPWWSLRWRWRLFAFSTIETSLGRI